MDRITITSAEELARRAEELMERVSQGEVAVVESAGRELAVLLDATDYRLLRALATCAFERRGAAQLQSQEEGGSSHAQTLRDFLSGTISLGKAAQLLGLSRFDLMDRFRRLGVPLGLGPSSLEDALAEIAVARRLP